MKLFDSHCHLDDKSYTDDFAEVLSRAHAAGVEKCLTVGISRESSASAIAIAEAHPAIYAAVGVHPHNARDCSEETLRFLADLAQNPKVHAWGEIGLDFNRMFSPRQDQEKWFQGQIEAADALGLPLVFHERDSQGRFLEILTRITKNERKGVVHCFSGNSRELEAYLELGLYIGITGVVTLNERGAGLRALVGRIPRERLLIETDAPFLTPAPDKNRTRRNEPAFVKSILLKLAQVFDENPQALAAVIWENTCRLFSV